MYQILRPLKKKAINKFLRIICMLITYIRLQKAMELFRIFIFLDKKRLQGLHVMGRFSKNCRKKIESVF